MASRKRAPDPNQIGMTLPVAMPPPVPLVEVEVAYDLDELDDYHEDATRLRLVDPPAPMPRVIVEAVGKCFEVSRLRDNGTTVACVIWSRDELSELVKRVEAALKM